MANKDLYDILGVPKDASQTDIKKAYRRLAREHHPDVSGDPESEARFKEITQAYEILSDPEKRQQYDYFGQTGKVFSPFEGFGDFGIFDTVFDSVFGDIFGQTRIREKRQPKGVAEQGSDLMLNYEIAFEESILGAEKEVDISRLKFCEACEGNGTQPGTKPSTCQNCQGTGQISTAQETFFGRFVRTHLCSNCQGKGEVILSPCDNCRGEGRVSSTEKVLLKIPAGSVNGLRLKIAGKGDAGRRGGFPGDLYVRLLVKPHPLFERHGDDILSELHVSITQAALGTELEVPTVRGSRKLKIPSGVQTGAVLKLKGEGAPNLQSGVIGDQLIHVVVQTPTKLTKEQKELLIKLAESWGEPVNRPSKGTLKKIRDAFSKGK